MTDVTDPPRPCRFCIANWTGISARLPGSREPILPTATDCEFEHRDDPRIYALARELARACGHPEPTDEHVGWFLADADDVVDDFTPAPQQWRVRQLPPSGKDEIDGIEVRLRINDVTYVALEGGKDCRGQLLPLARFRGWDRG